MNINKTPHCSTCKTEFDLTKSNKNILKDGTVSQYYRCRSCAKERLEKKGYHRRNIGRITETDTSRYDVVHLLKCVTCGTDNNLTTFQRNVNTALKVVRVYYVCNGCNSARHRKYYHAGGKDSQIAANKRYYERNKELINAKARAKYAEKKEAQA